MALEEDLQEVANADGDPWASMSMGEGRRLEPQFSEAGQLISGTIFEGCTSSPDGYHHFVAESNVQSVEHFVCEYCPANHYD